MKGYEDYIQPPSYVDTDVPKESQLITKLSLRIQQDLNQIHGVYDTHILESSVKMEKMIKRFEDEHKERVSDINNQRVNDIAIYNRKAEKHIDNLISSMHNSPQKLVRSWWDTIFDI